MKTEEELRRALYNLEITLKTLKDSNHPGRTSISYAIFQLETQINTLREVLE